MATHHIPELDTAGLRKFGITTGAIIAVLFGLILPWLFGLNYPKWPWIVGGVLALWGVIAPDTLRPVYVGWMKFGLMLSKITTPLVLSLVFFVAITPLALAMKVIKRDAMRRSYDADSDSYRIASEEHPPEQLEKPF